MGNQNHIASVNAVPGTNRGICHSGGNLLVWLAPAGLLRVVKVQSKRRLFQNSTATHFVSGELVPGLDDPWLVLNLKAKLFGDWRCRLLGALQR